MTLDEKEVDVCMFGARSDFNPKTRTGTDDTSASNIATQYVSEVLGGGTVIVPLGDYLISGVNGDCDIRCHDDGTLAIRDGQVLDPEHVDREAYSVRLYPGAMISGMGESVTTLHGKYKYGDTGLRLPAMFAVLEAAAVFFLGMSNLSIAGAFFAFLSPAGNLANMPIRLEQVRAAKP